MNTRIKICGITSLADAKMAVRAGADALGFVFYEPSPRYICSEQASLIIKQLPPFITTVGLFVNASMPTINAVVDKCGLDVVQLHGDESPAFCDLQKKRVIKAISVQSSEDLRCVDEYNCSILLDAKAPDGIYGGAGKTFDWSILKGLECKHPLILAGGLNTDNITQALDTYDWYAVDVSSGVEKDKGTKDADKVQFFCGLVQQFNVKDITDV